MMLCCVKVVLWLRSVAVKVFCCLTYSGREGRGFKYSSSQVLARNCEGLDMTRSLKVSWLGCYAYATAAIDFLFGFGNVCVPKETLDLHACVLYVFPIALMCSHLLRYPNGRVKGNDNHCEHEVESTFTGGRQLLHDGS